MTYSPEQAASSIHSLGSTPVVGSAPEDDTATHTTRRHVHESGPSPFTGVLSDIPSSSTGLPFNITDVNVSSRFPENAANALPSDVEIAATTPNQAALVGSSVLEELGLGGGWQPVMDDLGL
jgi:hypothetical protein